MSKNALIVMGTSPQLFSDLRRIPGSISCDFMAINEAAHVFLDPIKYWTSFHPEHFRKPQVPYKHWLEWEQKRRELGGNTDYLRISNIRLDGNVDLVCGYRMKTGSSSLLGVEAAIDLLGYKKIIVCGVDLRTMHYPQYQQGWIDNREELARYVRAFSGLPHELFGEPTNEWMEA